MRTCQLSRRWSTSAAQEEAAESCRVCPVIMFCHWCGRRLLLRCWQAGFVQQGLTCRTACQPPSTHCSRLAQILVELSTIKQNLKNTPFDMKHLQVSEGCSWHKGYLSCRWLCDYTCSRRGRNSFWLMTLYPSVIGPFSNYMCQKQKTW